MPPRRRQSGDAETRSTAPARVWRLRNLLPFRGRGKAADPATPWGESHVPDSHPGDWDSDGLRAAQMIWGHALLGPCSPDELAALAAWLKPRRSTRIALLGAGLGGFALALSRICRCRVTGFEQADMLLRLCPDLKHGHLRSLDSITVKTERSFDHVVVDGLGHRAGDIAPLLKPAAALVSPRGSIVIRAYHAVSAAARARPSHAVWRQSEPVHPHIPTRDELLRQIDRMGFAVRNERAVADVHVSGIEARWTSAVELIPLLHGKKNHQTLIPALITEAGRWQARAELIRAGEIGVLELHCRRATELPDHTDG